jgi:hypothetical protein
LSFKNVSVVLKGSSPRGEKPDPVAHTTAKSILLSLAVITVCVFFLAVGYDFPIYVWCGLTVGLRRVYERQASAKVLSADELEPASAWKPAFAPGFAKVQEPAEQPRTYQVAGRPVRFNRFR